MRLLLLITSFFTLTFHAQTFEKDPLFNPFQLPENKFYLENKPSLSLLQPDQKLLVIENYFLNINYSTIKRINLDNTLDSSFNTATELNGLVKDIALQPDGKIILVGSFTTFNNTSSKYIVRLNADGTKDIVLTNHTYNAQQIDWFKAGSALNLIAAEAARNA